MNHLQWFRWFAAAMIVLLGVEAVLITRAVDISSHKLEQVQVNQWAWSAVQGRIEAAELELRLTRLAQSLDRSSLEAAILYHQILLGRTRTWGAGAFAVFIGRNPRMSVLFDSIVSDLNTIGDILSFPPNREPMAKAVALAGALRSSVDRLGMGAYTYSISEMAELKDELHGNQTTQKVLIAFLFLVGMAFLFVTSWQNRSLARANAALAKSTRQLAESEGRLLGVLETTTDGVLVVDRDYRVKFANRNAIDWMFPNRPYLGLPLWVVVGSSPDSDVYTNYRRSFEQQIPIHFESYFAPLDVWLEDHVFPAPDSLTIFFRDVTERRRQREELVRLAQHDPLTGLANRTLFDERLAQGLACGRRQSGLVLVMIDLDDFKAVNDNFGHQAGDRLVQQFAKRLADLVRQGDTVARFGGDEFAIIQPGPVEPNGGAEVARRISEALLTPFDLDGTEVTLAVSIGIAMAPKHGARPEELVRNADLALYRAKECKGTGASHRMFEPGMDISRNSQRRALLKLPLPTAAGVSTHDRP